jgi:sugar phosphate permease
MPGPELGRREAVALASLLTLTTLMAYLARVNLSVALPFIADDYGWETAQLGELGGLLLGIFLIGYGISNVLIAPMVDHFGPKRGILASLLIFSTLTMLTGVLGLFYSVFLSLRLMIGLSQGVIFPSASKITQTCFPSGLRARVNAMYLSSGFIANLLAPLLLIPLIQLTDWETMFHTVGLAGLVLMLPIAMLVRDGTERRKTTAREVMKATRQDVMETVRSRDVVLLTVAFTTTALVWWGLSLWLPTYLEEAKGFSIDDLVWAASLPYIGGVAGMFFGAWLSDRSGKRVEVIITFLVLCSISVMLVTLTEGLLTVVTLAVVFFFQGATPPNVFTLLQGMVPGERISGATGFVNGISNGSGIFGTMAVGTFVALSGSYDSGLILIASVQLVGVVLFIVFRRRFGNA